MRFLINTSYFSILFFILAGFFTRCKKQADVQNQGHEPCKPVKTAITDPQLLQCRFKVGSYWVFQDSVTNISDTIKASGLDSFFDAINPGSLYDLQEQYVLSITSLYANLANCKLRVLPGSVTLANDGYPYNTVFSPQVKTGNRQYDSLYIYNQWYKNVYESATMEFVYDNNAGRPVVVKIQTCFNGMYGLLKYSVFDEQGRLLARKAVSKQYLIY